MRLPTLEARRLCGWRLVEAGDDEGFPKDKTSCAMEKELATSLNSGRVQPIELVWRG